MVFRAVGVPTAEERKQDTLTTQEEDEVNANCVALLRDKALRLRVLDLARERGCLDQSDSDEDDPAALYAAVTTEGVAVEPRECLQPYVESQLLEILGRGLLLRRQQHIEFLLGKLVSLPSGHIALDASHPWIIYWIVKSMTLLDGWRWDHERLRSRIPAYLKTMEHPEGGYGGGPRQKPHLATTYAAVAALVQLGDPDALKTLNRTGLYRFLKRMRDPKTKGFRMHDDGELDPRGAYCAVATAALCNLITDELFEGLEDYVTSLQTFDGGLAAERGLESHAGYTYCGLASLGILGRHHALDLHRLLFWAAHRHCDATGAFQGRPNKLSDSCYSFWGAGTLAVLSYLGVVPPDMTPEDDLWFNPLALQIYILGCCQDTLDDSILMYKGGLRDKPGARQDLYHTCYALCGLSLCQHTSSGHRLVPRDDDADALNVGPPEINIVAAVHPLYGITWNAWRRSRSYVSQCDVPQDAPDVPTTLDVTGPCVIDDMETPQSRHQLSAREDP